MIILFNKPYGVISQFSEHPIHPTLKNYIKIPNIYPAGRLDTDSEGLILLTDQGKIQHEISTPKYDKYKGYWVQVEGDVSDLAIKNLEEGVIFKDYKTKKAVVKKIAEPKLWERSKPIRFRRNIPTSWIDIQIAEGKNRQVRKMTAHVGFPTLRIVRYKIDIFELNNLKPGQYEIIK
jgi:23S rRNA pseudouridine2457 synthase